LETCFTTGRYDKVVELGRKLQHDLPKNDYLVQIPVGVLTYAAAALKNDRPAAIQQLDRLTTTLAGLPPEHRAVWSYSGTLTYLRSLDPAPQHVAPIIQLVEAAHRLRDGKPIPDNVIQANRTALAG
jgi:hypothetical protein